MFTGVIPKECFKCTKALSVGSQFVFTKTQTKPKNGAFVCHSQAYAFLCLAELASYAISDERRPENFQHTVVDMLRQRIYSIAAGYEDCMTQVSYASMPCTNSQSP